MAGGGGGGGGGAGVDEEEEEEQVPVALSGLTRAAGAAFSGGQGELDMR